MSDAPQPNRSRLARFLNAPGGMTREEAKARADSKIERLRPRSEADMAEALKSMANLLATCDGPPDAAVRKELHRLSCVLVSLGGTFGRAALSKAGYSLCRLLDELGEGWDQSAVDVHFNAMRLLFTPGAIPPEAQVRMVEGLHKVRSRVVAERSPGAD
ncbi:MAG: hypothetical protein R3C25_11900 [Hyphomonadaceae bacterium]